MSKKKIVKSELLQIRVTASRKGSFQASAKRQGTTMTKLMSESMDTMKIKNIKDNVVTIMDNMKHIEGIDSPSYDLKDGNDGANTDVQIIENLVNMLLEQTEKLNPNNSGIKGAIRKANGDYKPQTLSGIDLIKHNLKNK